MNIDLVIAAGVFLASALAVVYFGSQLAKYGDALATLTGWGRLFVGSILLAVATSLPELSTNISAVRLSPPNPELAVGNILGANMVNMFTLAVVALYFGGREFLQRVAPQQGYLILLAAVMTGAAVLFGAVRMEASFWQIGLSSFILLGIFLVGMRIVFVTRPQQGDGEGPEEAPSMTLRRAWVMFGLVSSGVVIAGFFLAWSTDQIAEITGVASSTLGILAVSVVTTMPEAAATIAAVRMGAVDLGVSGLFGSCVFNVTILAYADPFYRSGILNNQTEASHFVAGIVAIVLILAALALILGQNRVGRIMARAGLALMAVIYIAGAVAVVWLGAADSTDSKQTSETSPSHAPQKDRAQA
ncbi:MAG: sodium:calcium antiporter [Chloroflexi bacterium]|nr:sodium:calcium antiporter [Chloroflexota bacterium]MCH8350964.1 sodium:calcium antiporter [Chloroflexota bacterium]MCI0878381.1 sodium:calcium antiporter [Chloroflexota bacterium]